MCEQIYTHIVSGERSALMLQVINLFFQLISQFPLHLRFLEVDSL